MTGRKLDTSASVVFGFDFDIFPLMKSPGGYDC